MSFTKRVPLAERLWSRVQIGAPDECWPWLGAMNKQTGYGAISLPGRGAGMAGTHRVAYELTNGPVDGLEVRHTCDNRPCCNPGHLIPGSHAENMQDMAERARSGGTRLTAAQVLEIRSRTGERQSTLADEFGVTQANISAIVGGKTWKHLSAKGG